MKVIRVIKATTWERVKWAALHTVGLRPKKDSIIPDTWKKRMLLCEHSPIRDLEFDVEIESIKQWVTVHIVRHWLGFIPFVHTQREERRKLDSSRDELPQGSLNDMAFSANAQALINISRRRLCSQAAVDTRIAWNNVKDAIRNEDKVMASVMVPECVYRGFCPEDKCCGYVTTEAYKKRLQDYRNISNND